MSDIYGRILSRLEPSVLQRHCSSVLDDELHAISTELREIAAAYARLQDVREAVAKLENGRSDVRRSMSLMETVGSTAQMQNELMQRVGLVEAVLRSRPVAQLGNGNERNASETKEEDGETEQTTEPKKERKKRRRQESTSEEEWQPKEEEESPAESPVRKINKEKKQKTEKKAKGDSAVLEATSSREQSTRSTRPPVSSSSTSETKSEGDDGPILKADSKSHAMNNVDEDWVPSVFQAISTVTRIAKFHDPLPVEDVTSAVERLCGVLSIVTVPKGAKVSTLANGQLINLMILTIRMLENAVQDPLVASLAATIKRSIESGVARDPKLSALRKYANELTRIQVKKAAGAHATHSKHSTETAPATDKTSESKQSVFDWPTWRDHIEELLRASSRLSHGRQDLSFAEVSDFAGRFRDTMQTVNSTMATNMNASTRDDFFSVIASAAHIFECPGVTKPFIPLLNKVIFAIDDAIKLHSRFKSLRDHSQNLLAIRRRVSQAEQDDRHNTAASVPASVPQAKTAGTTVADKVSKRFEALVSVADELSAVELSERRGRVPNYVSALQKQLKSSLPTKGQRATQSRMAYEAIVDAVKKAIQLIQDEPHTDKNGALYKQFLELLDSIGGRYNMFKQAIARSRSDLYLYLSPDSAQTRKQRNISSKSSQAQKNAGSANQGDDENALYEQLQAAYNEAHSWNYDVFSLKEFDDVMRVLRSVMAINTKTWCVPRDHDVAACLALVAQRAHAIKKKEHREGRLASLAQWQLLMEV